ncbi:SMI1/KNR4 family protein [Streptomyces sp. NPDC048521]|uniref:SMI1/KNR4 family protein n=1 Tax=Streptomyces sp. NPDC048521 TaxID=3365566 RepID=UPI00371F9B8B
MTDSAAAPVAESWARIDAWLAAHAPASLARLRPPAEPAALAAAEQVLGMQLPADLAASLACHNGSDPDSAVLPPLADLLSVEAVVGQWELWNGVMDDMDEGEEPWGVIAGEVHWHRRWVPVTIFQGDLDVIDMRPGPGQGRFGSVPHDGPGYFGDHAWPSLGADLEAVADVLTTGRMTDPPRFDDPYVSPDGELIWG